MTVGREIWAFSEKPGLLVELIAGGRQLADQTGGKVVALVVGPRAGGEQAIGRGADETLWLGELAENRLVEDYVETIAAQLAQRKPLCLLVGATRRGKGLAGRLAARLGTAVLVEAKRLAVADGGLQATHLIFGGGAVRSEKASGEVTLITVGQGIFEALPADPNRSGPVGEAAFVQPAWRLALREKRQKPPVSVNLPAAKRVICAGRGVSKQEDMALLKELAMTLEGEVGCTRPLAEGLNWLPRETYIGVSGVFIKPELYVGVGVSGQVQHTVGITGSRVVVAINKDKNAPIFGQADYGLVGDLYKVVPELTKALKARR